MNISFIKRKDTYNLITGGTKGKSSTTTRKIAQYTIDGKFIRVWESIHEAEENLNVFSRQLIIHKHQLRLEMINNFLKELGRWLEVETLELNTFVVLDMVKNQFDHSDVLSKSIIKIKVWNGSKSEYSKMK